MKALTTLFAFVLLPCLSLGAQTKVLLGWDASPESSCAGYRLLAGTASRTYTMTNTVMGRLTTAGMITNIPSGKVFFAVVAFDTNGLESDFSNEVTWTNRLSAPKNFKLTGTIQAGLTPTGPWTNLADVNIQMPPMPTNQSASFFRSTLLLKELP